jgi:two-component system sensor histidine kinase UhpB
MSLRVRLYLMISTTFAVTLLIGVVLIIHNARQAVLDEIRSTGNLTLQLLALALVRAPPGDAGIELSDLQKSLAAIEQTRHLSVTLVQAGTEPAVIQPADHPRSTQSAPTWFVRLVEPGAVEMRRTIALPGLPARELVIAADPADEIAEAWYDARALLLLLSAFFLIANGLVFMTLRHSLRPIENILRGLSDIQQGDYAARLPRMTLHELDAIAMKFNHMAAVLQHSQDENRRLAQQSLTIQEQERRYLAHELHDEMGQSISAIKALAVTISQRSADRDATVRDSAQTIAAVSTHIYEVVRGMMRRLRPVVLDELGLVPALQDVIDDWNGRHADTFCQFSADGDFAPLPDELEIGIYRIVQEALTNVAKHARATAVTVALQRRQAPPDIVALTITDDGIGFERVATDGLGLRGMRDRVEALRGEFRLDTARGRGVTIRISFPVPNEEQAFQ